MLNCRQVSQLVSESLDRKLSLWQRANLWIHLGMCRLCYGFRKDLLHLHDQTRRHASQLEQESDEEWGEDPGVQLSDESRERMKRAPAREA